MISDVEHYSFLIIYAYTSPIFAVCMAWFWPAQVLAYSLFDPPAHLFVLATVYFRKSIRKSDKTRLNKVLQRTQQLCQNVIQTCHYVCIVTITKQWKSIGVRERERKKRHKNILCNRL